MVSPAALNGSETSVSLARVEKKYLILTLSFLKQISPLTKKHDLQVTFDRRGVIFELKMRPFDTQCVRQKRKEVIS